MLTALLATVTSLLFGGSDFLGGLASRRDAALAVVADSHLAQTLLLLAVALATPAAFAARDLGFGAITGLSGGLGVVALYAALAAGRMGIVAPIAAALSGALPALFDLARGTHVGARSVAGLALALVAVVVVSVAPGEHEPHEMPLRAIALAALAGCGFGAGFVSLSFASAGSGLWPLVAARVTSAVILSGTLLVRQRRLLVAPPARWMTASAALFEALGNVAILAAIRIGPLAVATVLGSMFPVVVLVLARVFLHERLRWLQRLGVVAALAAVVLTALP